MCPGFWVHITLIVLTIFSGIFIRWKTISNDKNEAFADAARQIGFTKEETGLYVLQQDGVNFRLPNQKLPFLKDDFYVKNIYADLIIDGTEIDMALYDGMTFTIELNHYRSLEGLIDQGGKVVIEENTLNKQEQQFYDSYYNEINDTLKQLVTIYEAVYT